MTRKTALIIDDNALNHAILGKLLTEEGFEYTFIQDPRKITEYIENQQAPNIIFVDLEMPYMDGYEVLNALRKKVAWKPIPIVACTVHHTEIENAIDAQFHSFLGKPLNAERFPVQLAKILSGQRVWDLNAGA